MEAPVTTQVGVLGPLMDAATKLQRERDSWGPPRSLYASTIGTTCERLLYYQRLGLPEETQGKPEWLRNATTGSSLHTNYQQLVRMLHEVSGGKIRLATSQEILTHAGLTLKDFAPYLQKKGLPREAMELPLPLNPVTDIGGKGDGIVWISGAFDLTVEKKGQEPYDTHVEFQDELVLLEIKTVKHKDWTAAPKNHKWHHWFSQCQVYLHFYQLKRAIIFVINRNDDTIKEFLIEYDPVFTQGLLDKAERVRIARENNVVPPATFDPWGDCLFCPFKSRCDLQELQHMGVDE